MPKGFEGKTQKKGADQIDLTPFFSGQDYKL